VPRSDAHYRGYRIEAEQKGCNWHVDIHPTQPDLPILSQHCFVTLIRPGLKLSRKRAVGLIGCLSLSQTGGPNRNSPIERERSMTIQKA
jgi:hypothetical protein